MVVRSRSLSARANIEDRTPDTVHRRDLDDGTESFVQGFELIRSARLPRDVRTEEATHHPVSVAPMEVLETPGLRVGGVLDFDLSDRSRNAQRGTHPEPKKGGDQCDRRPFSEPVVCGRTAQRFLLTETHRRANEITQNRAPKPSLLKPARSSRNPSAEKTKSRKSSAGTPRVRKEPTSGAARRDAPRTDFVRVLVRTWPAQESLSEGLSLSAQ